MTADAQSQLKMKILNTNNFMKKKAAINIVYLCQQRKLTIQWMKAIS